MVSIHLRSALIGLGWCGNDDQAFAVTLKAADAAAAVIHLINVFSGVHELAVLGLVLSAAGKEQ